MLNYLKEEANRTHTENGAAAFVSTQSHCLDLFSEIGAIRHATEDYLIDGFVRAYTEDADLAMKILFYGRDIRGGLGERRVFRTILRWLGDHKPESVRKNIHLVAEYGRFDDLLVLIGTKCEADALSLIRKQFFCDLAALEQQGNVSLLGKWLPSVNASNKDAVRMAKHIARYLGLNDAAYRKHLSRLRKQIRIIENNLREQDYTFDYSKQPSKAMLKYRKAFIRNDEERYLTFLNRVQTGDAKLNASVLYPYEVVAPFLNLYNGPSFMREISEAERVSLNATWESLPDYGSDENALVVVDTSGSMYWGDNPKPAHVALSLGLYFAERNKGLFHNHFIEFSARPQLIEIKGETFADRLRYIASFNEVANTDLNAVFKLILDAAVKHGVPQEELPKRLYIISDMEFDQCVEGAELTNFQCMKYLYREAGYELPEVVFWNVQSRNRRYPVTMNEQGVALISGCTPQVLSMVDQGILTPYQFMMSVMESERYEKIVA